jgi:hypothetical protein
VATYLKQFENLYYTYTAASVLFNEWGIKTNNILLFDKYSVNYLF